MKNSGAVLKTIGVFAPLTDTAMRKSLLGFACYSLVTMCGFSQSTVIQTASTPITPFVSPFTSPVPGTLTPTFKSFDQTLGQLTGVRYDFTFGEDATVTLSPPPSSGTFSLTGSRSEDRRVGE